MHTLTQDQKQLLSSSEGEDGNETPPSPRHNVMNRRWQGEGEDKFLLVILEQQHHGLNGQAYLPHEQSYVNSSSKLPPKDYSIK